MIYDVIHDAGDGRSSADALRWTQDLRYSGDVLKSAQMMRSALASCRSFIATCNVRVVHANYTLTARTCVPCVLSVAAIRIIFVSDYRYSVDKKLSCREETMRLLRVSVLVKHRLTVDIVL